MSPLDPEAWRGGTEGGRGRVTGAATWRQEGTQHAEAGQRVCARARGMSHRWLGSADTRALCWWRAWVRAAGGTSTLGIGELWDRLEPQ